MFEKCLNSDCELSFDFREGRLISFCKSPPDDDSPRDHHWVEHFWLCRKCSELYVFVYETKSGMGIKPRLQDMRERALSDSATAA
jgi:hypothetical protein